MIYRAYLDSSIWITRFEGSTNQKQILNSHITPLSSTGWVLCFSDAVLLEVMTKPHQRNQQNIIISYRNLFNQSSFLPSYKEILEEAFRISVLEKLKALDSIHIAIALHYKCDLFITTDIHFKNITSIPIHWIDLTVKI